MSLAVLLLALLPLQADAAAPYPKGAAASSEEQATAAACRVLARGGNAVDAAVALHFALAVTYPAAGNLGGGGFMLVHLPGGENAFLDFREVAPLAAGPDLYRTPDGGVDPEASRTGWKAVAVPGAVFGLAEAHRRWGRLPWPEVVAPAIRLAREGFVVDEEEAARLAAYADVLRTDPVARETFFLPDGRPLPAGARCRQPRLAATLERIAAEGEAAFRSGPIVDELVAASQAGGGILSAEDFAAYRPELRPVARIPWRDVVVLAPTPPSSGAVFLGQVLPCLEDRPLRRWGWADGRTVNLVGEAEALAFATRNRFLGDPAAMAVDWRDLVAPARVEALCRRLSERRRTPPDALVASVPGESLETTHFSVVDGAGGAVSCTTTLNAAYGAKVMAPGGFFLNDEMDDFAAAPGAPNQFGLVQGEANAVRAGMRPLSSMCPVIVLRDDEVDAVLGSPGGPTILTTVLQVLLHRYVFRMDPREAVAAARFHRQDLPDVLRFEPERLDGAARDFLFSLGQPLEEVGRLGDVNAIFRTAGGRWTPVCDPRRSGAAWRVANPPPAPRATPEPVRR